MTDYDSIWRTQDEIRTVVNAVLDDDAISDLCCQFPIIADYDGVGAKGYTQSKPVQSIPIHSK